MRNALVSIVVCAALASLGGCRHRQPAVAAPPPATVPEPPPPPPPPSEPDVAPAAPLIDSEEEAFRRKSLEELNAEHPLGDALFDLDSARIRPDARAVLDANAQWLTRWPSTRATIEGHCDERGTAEYNLGLGERRATAVRSYLLSLGIAAERLAATTKGKEAPACLEHTEDCWQQNRRGRFVVTAK